MSEAPAILTIGYERASLGGFLDTLTEARVETVVDVREVPWSRRREFAMRALAEALEARGIGYVHLKGLGTPKPGRDAARAGDMETFRQIFDAQLASDAGRADLDAAAERALVERICLMCYERDPECCHRSVVVERLELMTNLEARHLRPEIT